MGAENWKSEGEELGDYGMSRLAFELAVLAGHSEPVYNASFVPDERSSILLPIPESPRRFISSPSYTASQFVHL